MSVETRKLTQGALLSAIQIVLGLSFISTGVGYSFYMAIILPIMMSMIYLRCGFKIGLLAGVNTLLIIFFSFGNLVSTVYMSIASVPITSVLITYIGSLFLGHRLGFLNTEGKHKYQLLHRYKVLYPYSYHSRKMSCLAITGMLGCLFIWSLAKGRYLKALVASSGIILLYFVLMDFMKLLDQYLLETGKPPIVISFLHIGVIILLMNAFKLTSCSIILIGCMLDYKTPIRERQQQALNSYL